MPLGIRKAGVELIIGVHAVIEREEYVLITKAPYPAFHIVAYEQGLRKNKTAVREGRSNPEAALTNELGQDEIIFFIGF